MRNDSRQPSESWQENNIEQLLRATNYSKASSGSNMSGGKWFTIKKKQEDSRIGTMKR